MKERPILFSAPMVRAILEGRKTQTRRIMKPQPETNRHGLLIWSRGGNGGQLKEENFRELIPAHCPYGRPGDRLWVRETWDFRPWASPPENPNAIRIAYGADGAQRMIEAPGSWSPTIYGTDRWRPSIHMPRWASRITLEVVSVRVERLQKISAEDCVAEGLMSAGAWARDLELARPEYARLWESINGPGSWDASPWVWVITFRRIEQLEK